ncbi:hypothetical protein APA_2275 [Pseudanabaena sp. lw0831]|nr:hypothetical protein APA_2275 [Pseudanabaena sp. lw0831]
MAGLLEHYCKTQNQKESCGANHRNLQEMLAIAGMKLKHQK